MLTLYHSSIIADCQCIDFSYLMTFVLYYIAGPSTSPRKKAGKKKQKKHSVGDEAGEETDEGDMESQEVDYMTDSSSASEKEYKVGMASLSCGVLQK